MQWMGIWNHHEPVTIALADPDFDSQLKAWVTLLGNKPYHYAVVEAPKLLAHQCGAHIRYLNHFIWMGIWNHQQPVTTALVDLDFESWLTSSWVTLLGSKPYHYAVFEARKSYQCICIKSHLLLN